MGWQEEPEEGPDEQSEPTQGPTPPHDARPAGFAEGREWDTTRPSGALAMALDTASGPSRRCPGATEDELAGLARQWQAVESWAAAGRLGVIRAMIRNQGGSQTSSHGDLPETWGESLIHQLALTLATSVGSADHMASLAWQLEARLPRIGALLDAGKLTLPKARMIVEAFGWLTDADAAEAEQLILARLAAQPGLTWAQLAKLAARFACQIDPEQAERRRKDAEKHETRVRLWREQSGAAGLMGCNLPADEALAAMAAVNARAAIYLAAGVFDKATMDQLRAMAYLDLLNGITAVDRVAHATSTAQPPAAPSQGAGPENGQDGDRSSGNDYPEDNGPGDDGPGDDGPGDDGPGNNHPGDDGPGNNHPGNNHPGNNDPGNNHPGNGSPGAGHPDSGEQEPAALVRRTDLVIPLVTLLGLAERPGEAHGLGVLDPGLCRDLAAAAAWQPATRLCITVTDREGFAVGHGCAKPARRRNAAVPGHDEQGPPSKPASLAALAANVNLTISETALRSLAHRGRGSPARSSPWTLTQHDHPGPADGYGAWTLGLPGGAGLIVKLGPVPTHECDHRHASSGYVPNDLLRHLVQIRDGDCTFPPCSKHARESDFEHALAYAKGGRTCACNAGARSRRCHRIKQSPGWIVTQPKPGWHQWTTPAGRAYTQEPKRYPV